MCGIVGYTGGRQVVPILLDALRSLEYRGYDSAGMAVIQSSQLHVLKCRGRIDNLVEMAGSKSYDANIGIGHTRWATHGQPSEINAHPHFDCSRELVIVHNGIIENYQKLKENLSSRGHVFRSDTDTEVLVHLIEEYYEEDLEFAIKAAMHEVKGTYALVALSERDMHRLYAARSGSPLVIGLGDGENYIASDIPALLEYTRKVLILEEEEVAVITRDSVSVSTIRNTPVKREPVIIEWDRVSAEKKGYEHFMLKEIHEQPLAVENTLKSCMDSSKLMPDFSDIELPDIGVIKRVVIIGCGTSYHAGLLGKKFIESIAGIVVEVDVASEFRYRAPLIDNQTIVVAISQSGETADTIAGLREAQNCGAFTLGIVNVAGSTIAREAHGCIQTHAGPEIGVASTKCFAVQVAALNMLALWMAGKCSALHAARAQNICNALKDTPHLLRTVLDLAPQIRDIAHRYHFYDNFLYLGRGMNYPLALEGALKLKEISYIHAEAYPAGEMKHGPIALISSEMPTFVVATGENAREKVHSNIMEVKARDGLIIGLLDENDHAMSSVCDDVIFVPECNEYVAALVNSVPLQLFAYYMAEKRGCDIDKPRNLAKTVTVE